jgi:hypothetical protein
MFDNLPPKPFIYVAGPYTHKWPEIQELRGIDHCKFTAELLKAGYLVYSPIAETMMLAKYGQMHDTTWETWREKDLRQLSLSDEMIILPLTGWQDSIGLRGEIKYCLQNNIPMFIMDLFAKVLSSVDQQNILTLLNVEAMEDLND